MRQRRSVATKAALSGLVLALAFASFACDGAGRGAARGGRSHGGARVGGAVVSTVGGQPITLRDVQDLVSHSDLTPHEALHRLQAERLLMIEAERREYGLAAPVDQVARQARVQALLDAITEEASVGDEEIRAAYEKAKARFERPELRVAVHVLATPPKQATPEADTAARAFAADVIEELARATDVKTFLVGMRGKQTPHFVVSAEALPPFGRNANLVPAFLEAVFALQQPGVVPEPVKTRFGWHAIRVLVIQPAVSVAYAEAAEQLRPGLVLERKKQIVDEFIASARKRHGVELGAELRQTLAKLEL